MDITDLHIKYHHIRKRVRDYIIYDSIIARYKLIRLKRWYHETKFYLVYLLLMEDHVVDRSVNAYIRNYYEYWKQNINSDFCAMKYFTDVRVKRTKRYVSIKITTKSPGLFIGKGGKDYDDFVHVMEDHFKRKVIVHLIELKYW